MARKITATITADALVTAPGKAPAATEAAKINREQWLENAVRALAPVFAEAGILLPTVRVSCGFPKGNVRKVIGQCWNSKSAGDGVAQIFVTPFLSDSVEVLAILVHELIHAVDDCQSGHKGDFVKMMKVIGLEGKATATVAGEGLRETLKGLVADGLGDYPHASLVEGEGPVKKQGTRMLKVECPEDGYTVRTTEKWLAVGTPTCPCGQEMVRA